MLKSAGEERAQASTISTRHILGEAVRLSTEGVDACQHLVERENEKTRKNSEHLVEGALGLRVHDLLQHAPVRAGDGLGDAAAALQIELVHLLADVVPQHRGAPPDGPLEGADGRPCRCTQASSIP